MSYKDYRELDVKQRIKYGKMLAQKIQNDYHQTQLIKDGFLCCDMNGLDEGVQTAILSYISNHSELITHLNIYGADEITDLSALANFPELQYLSLTGCRELEDLSVLSKCHNLQNLSIHGCPKVINLSGLAKCHNLQNLSIHGCPKVTDLSGLENCTKLQNLSLQECQNLTDLSVLANFPKLQSLSLQGCHDLENLRGLEQCTYLQSLSLNGCQSLTDLSVLENCPELQSLSLQSSQRLTVLSVLEKCTKLQKLTLQSCQGLTDLSVLENFPELQSLSLQSSQRLTDLSVLEKCTKLQKLSLQSCQGLTDLSGLAKCTKLQNLTIKDCPELKDISGLENCPELQKLSLQGCHDLENLSVLAKCHNLQNLSVNDCPKVTDLSVLANCTELQSLIIYECLNLDVTKLDVQIYQTLKSLKIGSKQYMLLPKQWIDGLFRHPTLEDITLRSKPHTKWIMIQQLVKEAIRLKNEEETVSTLTPLQEKIQENLNPKIVGDDNFYYCLYVYAGLYQHQGNKAKFEEMLTLYEQTKRPEIKKLAAEEVLYLWSLTKLHELMTARGSTHDVQEASEPEPAATQAKTAETYQAAAQKARQNRLTKILSASVQSELPKAAQAIAAAQAQTEPEPELEPEPEATIEAEDTQSEGPELTEQKDLRVLRKGISFLQSTDLDALSATTKQQILTVLQYLNMNLSKIESDSKKCQKVQSNYQSYIERLSDQLADSTRPSKFQEKHATWLKSGIADYITKKHPGIAITADAIIFGLEKEGFSLDIGVELKLETGEEIRYCIELDGKHHEDNYYQVLSDKFRDEYLKENGWHVIRLKNREVREGRNFAELMTARQQDPKEKQVKNSNKQDVNARRKAEKFQKGKIKTKSEIYTTTSARKIRKTKQR